MMSKVRGKCQILEQFKEVICSYGKFILNDHTRKQFLPGSNSYLEAQLGIFSSSKFITKSNFQK